MPCQTTLVRRSRPRTSSSRQRKTQIKILTTRELRRRLAWSWPMPSPYKELDVDEDGNLTLLDAYIYTCQKIAQEYLDGMLLSTEHAQLDDTGDGRASEVQADYLSEELGGRFRASRGKPILRTGDGALARKILLDYPPSPPVPEEEAPTVEKSGVGFQPASEK